MVEAAAKIDTLIRKAEQDRLYHKQRGQIGYIEASAAAIRIKALKDAKEVINDTDSD